jgi:beta-lactamase superfamily II metal-dependent hydrolase
MKKARELLWPSAGSGILVRFVFLHVGQGSSTIVLARDGASYKCLLVDINLDADNDGIDVPRLIFDLLDGHKLDVFVNTHPHDDHLRGIVELADGIEIGELWHSGHKPGKKYDDAYKNLQKVIKKVKEGAAAGSEGERRLEASPERQTIGEVSYYILAPKESVADDVQGEDQDTRTRRIHEQCAVLRFGTGSAWVMVPGDAGRAAFENHIVKDHRDRLASVVLAAAHHGSRSFFMEKKEDDPYLGALDAIKPEYVVISAQKQNAQKDDPPHADAIDLYTKKTGAGAVLHTGERGYSFISDIYDGGSYSGIRDDKGELRTSYPIGGREKALIPPIIVRTRVDDRPMGK